jgi:hypothetical protein
MIPTGAVKTATDRATEAVEAAERMYADEMGATLNLSPAARVAAIALLLIRWVRNTRRGVSRYCRTRSFPARFWPGDENQTAFTLSRLGYRRVNAYSHRDQSRHGFGAKEVPGAGRAGAVCHSPRQVGCLNSPRAQEALQGDPA